MPVQTKKQKRDGLGSRYRPEVWEEEEPVSLGKDRTRRCGMSKQDGDEHCVTMIFALAVIVFILYALAQAPSSPHLEEWEDRTRG